MWSAHGQQVGLWTILAAKRGHILIRSAVWVHSGVDGPMLTAFPKSAAYGERALCNMRNMGEMICGRCFRVHSNRPGDTEENGEALLKRASFDG